MLKRVHVLNIEKYDEGLILQALPDRVFKQIKPGDKIAIKPNWVLESHKYRKDEWEYVITHGAVISAVLDKTIEMLKGRGHITIIDGPTTEASFKRLLSRYPVEEWEKKAKLSAIPLSIVDLRDWEWETHKDVIVKRKALGGDPKGKIQFNLVDLCSEFSGHTRSKKGYYGADYDTSETNSSHDGYNNIYSVSKTVIESDVFINLPKLKTHRKAGITACLKNLVGINTFKNFLPHYSEGGPGEGGDQFPIDSLKTKIEGPLTTAIKNFIFNDEFFAKRLSLINDWGKFLFGKTGQVIRSGNWHGNNTIWRMIIDLNKILFFGNPDGKMRNENFHFTKKYIGVVDAVLAGQGFGPLEPDPVKMGFLFCGTNPVAIDTVCAAFMGFDHKKIPSIVNAYRTKRFNFCPFKPEDIEFFLNESVYGLYNLPEDYIFSFEAPLGWKGHVEGKNHKGNE